MKRREFFKKAITVAGSTVVGASSLDAKEITKLALKENLNADVFGPLAFDNSISKKSASIKNIKNKSIKINLAKFIKTKVFDIRKKLPFEDNSVEACFSHMLYCMALSNSDLENLNNEICRVLKPGWINIYTARHTDDGDYKNGIHRGENLYENDGFIVHFFSKEKVNQLSKGFEVLNIEKFEEGNFPRKLFLVKNKKI